VGGHGPGDGLVAEARGRVIDPRPVAGRLGADVDAVEGERGERRGGRGLSGEGVDGDRQAPPAPCGGGGERRRGRGGGDGYGRRGFGVVGVHRVAGQPCDADDLLACGGGVQRRGRAVHAEFEGDVRRADGGRAGVDDRQREIVDGERVALGDRGRSRDRPCRGRQIGGAVSAPDTASLPAVLWAVTVQATVWSSKLEGAS
jgi:hypothetical protein